MARADVAQDPQRLTVASASSRRSGMPDGSLEPGEHERVDPLRVGRALDLLRELGPDVGDEVVAHARELAQVAVVGQRDAAPWKRNGCRFVWRPPRARCR